MKTLQVLDTWRHVNITVVATAMKNVHAAYVMSCVVSPEGKMYRLANHWEQPDLLVTSPLWAAERDVRLVRVRDKRWKKLIQRKLNGRPGTRSR